MNINELIKLSIKALLTNKLRTLLTTLGVIIGVFSIILLVSIGSGLQGYITNQISSLGPNVIFVIPGSSGGLGAIVANKLTIKDSENLKRRMTSIANVAPELRQLETIKYRNIKTKGAFVLGTSSDYPDVVSSVRIAKGNFFTQGQENSGVNVAIIGQTVYSKFFKDQNAIGKRIFIGTKQYNVIGVFEKIGSFAGVDADNIAVIPIEAASQQYGINSIARIDISARNQDLLPTVKSITNKTLLRRLTADDFSIMTAESIISTVSNITNILSVALGGIAAISLLVGGIGVANIMLVSVTERTREIGLRKALGARRADILKQFLFEAVILSVGGGVIGIIFGLAASFVLSKFFVSQVTPWSVLLAFGFSAGVGIIFGMAPAIRASRLSPIDALRYE